MQELSESDQKTTIYAHLLALSVGSTMNSTCSMYKRISGFHVAYNSSCALLIKSPCRESGRTKNRLNLAFQGS